MWTDEDYEFVEALNNFSNPLALHIRSTNTISNWQGLELLFKPTTGQKFKDLHYLHRNFQIDSTQPHVVF